jgi:hypothetical protein
MNATHAKGWEGSDGFLNLVDFKWLMAGMGWWVDLSRLQSDRPYIDECLQRALRSDSELLRQRSVKLLGLNRDAAMIHGVHGTAVGVRDLRHDGAPLGGMDLRPQDRTLAWNLVATTMCAQRTLVTHPVESKALTIVATA